MNIHTRAQPWENLAVDKLHIASHPQRVRRVDEEDIVFLKFFEDPQIDMLNLRSDKFVYPEKGILHEVRLRIRLDTRVIGSVAFLFVPMQSLRAEK